MELGTMEEFNAGRSSRYVTPVVKKTIYPF